LKEPAPGVITIGISTWPTVFGQLIGQPGPLVGRNEIGGSPGLGEPPPDGPALGVALPESTISHGCAATGSSVGDAFGAESPHPPRINGSAANTGRILVSRIRPPGRKAFTYPIGRATRSA
jgi:hypothetical protein